MGSDIESLPMPEEKDFRDYILVLPIPNMPPVYVYLSKNKDTQIWTKTKKLLPVSNAYNHWEKHKHEFPELKNSKEYVDATHDFVNNPPNGTLRKKRANGDEIFYHPLSNTFASKSKDGIPRTMFKPERGIEYWNRQ